MNGLTKSSLWAAMLLCNFSLAADNLQNLARGISAYFEKNPGKTLAILAFKHSDNKASAEVTGVQERLMEQLVALGAVTVIERERIEQVLQEHALDQSGLTDRARLGQLLQADFLLTGSIVADRKGRLDISARLVEVATSKVVTTARTNINRSEIGLSTIANRATNYYGEPLVQMAILLDTSSSMDGLIDQARTQLWKIINTLAAGNREGKKPRLEVALYEYGNSNLSTRENYIRRILPFTTKLDLVSEKLFELKTDGGEEYPGAVMARALSELDWKNYDDVYRVIFIAGNEPFTQGPVDFRASAEKARAMGIFVNTIFCGSRQEGIATQWLAGAQLAGGDFHFIDQNQVVQVMATPYDEEIRQLGAEYNTTVIPMGRAGRAEKERMHAQDAKIAAAAPASGATVERAMAKSAEQYSAGNDWDLTSVFSQKKSIEGLPREQLPAELQKKSDSEITAYVRAKEQKRAKIQARIAELKRKRDEYISTQAKGMKAPRDLASAMQSSIRSQGKKAGLVF